jgi:glycolate oxidase FAD binding subunit
VKNVAGYDLPKLMTGALGTLGVITRAIFRLHPLPKMARTFSASAGNLETSQQLLHAVQNSKLAHIAMQVRAAHDTAPHADILFEGSEAGLAAQETHLKKLFERLSLAEAPRTVWNARQELWSASDSAAIVKFSALPTEIGNTLEMVRRVADRHNTPWKAVVQAIGIGWLRLGGPPNQLHSACVELRSELERAGGSLVVLHRPAGLAPLDAWGTVGDALMLMRAVKQQFDPKNTLNPGRFVGGI